MSFDIWMSVIVLFSPSADSSHSAMKNSFLTDLFYSGLNMNSLHRAFSFKARVLKFAFEQ